MILHRFDGKTGQHLNAGVQLLQVQAAEYGPQGIRDSHTHPHTQLIYVLSGEGCCQIEDEMVTLAPNDLLLINPHVSHCDLLGTNPSMYALTLDLSCPYFFDAMEQRYVYLKADRLEDLVSVRRYMQNLLHEVKCQPTGFEQMCQRLAEVVVLSLSRQCKPASNTRKSSRECIRVRLYIDRHFTETITLDDLAQYANLNKYYLVHVFNREMGCSPISYLIDRRISESKRLLSSSSLSIRQISQEMGFSSPSYFSQSFRRSTGCSPAEYRRQSQRDKRF